MASISVVSIVALICIVSVQGFTRNDAPSVGGIYLGRFGPSNIKISAQAVFNMGGVTGSVAFSQSQPGAPVDIHVSLQGLDQFTDEYSWRVRTYPVRSSLLVDFPCSTTNLGDEFYPLGDMNGLLNYEAEWQTFSDSMISLSGFRSIIGRSLVIEREGGNGGDFICANIEQLGARREIIRAPFNNGVIQGDVIFRYAVGRDDVAIEADLFRIDGNPAGTGATWSLHYSTPGADDICDVEQAIFGSSNVDGDGHGPKFNCDSGDQQRECLIGDLTSKCGPLDFVMNRARTFCTDSQLGTVPRTVLVDQTPPGHSLVLVVRDQNGDDLGCTALEVVKTLSARSQFRGLYGFGDFYFWQTGPDDRTYVRAHVTGLDRRQNHFLRIYENALTMNQECTFAALGRVISRQNGDFLLPGEVVSSGCLGNLDNIIPFQGVTSFRDTVSTSSLPLFGHNSIIGRTLALIREDDNMIVGCGTITRQPGFPESEIASLLGYQNENNPPLPPIPITP